MNILFLNAYFFPEQISFTHLERDILDRLVEEGNTVSVICPIPTRGVDDAAAARYAKIKYEEMYGGAVRVTRFNAPREGRNPVIRAFRYLWCNIREYSLARRCKDVDLVFAVSTPPTQGLLAGKVAKKLKVPFVYSLQDIFPDSLVTTGLSKKDSVLWKIGRKIEDATYRSADRIVVISESFKENVLQKGVPEKKISLISNWIDTDVVKPVAKEDNGLYGEFGIDKNKFTVVYAGNFGAAQGADVVLRAAEAMRSDDGVQFAIFGGGAEFETAKAFVKEKQLSNVIINGLLPQNRISEVYSLGDVALITCKKGVGNSGMPSKTWSIMACNTPIIASFDEDSELARIIKKAKAGVCVEPENSVALVTAIKEAMHNTSECHSREYAEQSASKRICVSKYADIFNSLKNEVDQ